MSLKVLQVMQRAARILGTLPAGMTLGGADGQDMLTAFNAPKRSWFGTLIGPVLSPIGLTGASGQAENGGEYAIPGGAATTPPTRAASTSRRPRARPIRTSAAPSSATSW